MPSVLEAPKKVSRVKKAPSRLKKNTEADLASGYNQYKQFEGTQYTGMQVGRSHKWYYDKGEWKETKINPDLWEIAYSVTKRRAGKAPKGSGVPVGTEYHWYIMAHQHVKKINANDYTTTLTGLKYKLAHRRADKDNWNTTTKTQRKKLVKLLQEFIVQLQKDPVPLDFEYKGIRYKGEGIPLTQSCKEDVCYEFEIML